MDGVEVLNTIYEYSNLISPIWMGVSLLVLLAIGILGLLTINYDTVQDMLYVLSIIGVICTVTCMVGAIIETDKIVDTKYQVIISEEVSFTEFAEKYEILNQEGRIYTVREIKEGF